MANKNNNKTSWQQLKPEERKQLIADYRKIIATADKITDDYNDDPDMCPNHVLLAIGVFLRRMEYGTEIYGDFLCKVNGISNPFEINEDDVLIIPNLNNMGDFMVDDKFDDSLSDSSDRPKPKAKNEKRKANEAIVGDTRFKIDKENHVIIY